MNHLPYFKYSANERTRYKVRIERLDEFSRKDVVENLSGFHTLEKAQRAYIDRREELNYGASNFGDGNVFDQAGQHVARISYNGRLWEPWTGKLLSEAPHSDRNRLYATVRKLEDVVSPSLLKDLDIDLVDIPDRTLNFLREITQGIMASEEMQPAKVCQELARGDQNEIEVLICSQSALDYLFGAAENWLGLHVVDTPDADPFHEESAHSRKFRVAIAWDNERFGNMIEEGAVTRLDREHNAEAWLVTLAHELMHVKLFAENGNFNSPADIDSMSDDIGHDLFDVSTGYGMRALAIDGKELWAEDATDAARLMEDYCERHGRAVIGQVASGRLSAAEFLETVEHDEGVDETPGF